MRQPTTLAGILLVVLFAGGLACEAATPHELLNKFRDASPRSSKTVKVKTNSGSQKSAEREPLRVAGKPRSVLRLGEEHVSKSADLTSDVVEEVESSAEEKKAEAEAKRVESTIDRKMKGLERSLQREEKKLETRLEELNRKRETALKKSDEKTLKRIEALEKQSVADYEKRVNRLLAAMSSSQQPTTQRSGQPSPVQRSVGNQRTNSKSSVPSYNRSQPTRMNRKPAPQRQNIPQPKPRRRFKLWPFR